jgi:hypothetical protein
MENYKTLATLLIMALIFHGVLMGVVAVMAYQWGLRHGRAERSGAGHGDEEASHGQQKND